MLHARRLAALLAFAGLVSIAAAQDKATPPATAQTPPSPRVAGTIEFSAGDAMIEAGDGKTRQPQVGETVAEGDTIVTRKQGELHLLMEDGASLSVRENSRMKIAAYVAEGGKNDRSVLELLQGSLRSVTGWIGRFNRAAYQINTPTATIGVRGTDHEPTYIPAGDPRGEHGTYDKVNEGRSFLQSGSQTVDIGANQAGFHPASGAARPRVLPSVPTFFRPAPNEQRFVARSREVRTNLDQRRVERQDAVRRLQYPTREGPSKAAPSAPRTGTEPQRPGPRGAGPREGAPSAPARDLAPGAKQGRFEGAEKSLPPRGGRPAGPGAHPGTSDAPKAQPNFDRAAKAEKGRAERRAGKQHDEAGEHRPPQAGGGRHR